MRSHGKGVESATTQVKVSSTEIILVALGQGFHVLEANTGARAKGERVRLWDYQFMNYSYMKEFSQIHTGRSISSDTVGLMRKEYADRSSGGERL